MAEAQAPHRHICSSLLKELRQRVEAAQPGGGRDVLDKVYDMALNAVWRMRCCYRHGRVGLQVAKDAIFKNEDPRHISAKMAHQITYLGVVMMELFSLEEKTHDVNLYEAWDAWKPALWKAVLLVSYCTPEIARAIPLQTRITREFIKDVFHRRLMRPSSHLQLEMIRFMMMWPDTLLKEDNIALDVLHAVAVLGSCLTLHDMLPRGRPSLSGPLACLLQNFHHAGVLKVLTGKAFRQINRLCIDAEARFLAQVVRLLGEKAKTLRHMCHNASLDLLVVMEEYQYLLETLKILVTSNSCKVAFRLPGLTQVGAIAIATTSISLYKSSFKLAAADEARFRNLTTLLNDIFESVRQENETLGRELMSRHERTLARAACLADKARFPLRYLPLPLQDVVPENCPEVFLDTVTGRLMEQPVWMIPSCVVVDVSTLVGFMLFSVDHPSFTLLSDLQREIIRWKTGSGSRPRLKEFMEPIEHFRRIMARHGVEFVPGHIR